MELSPHHVSRISRRLYRLTAAVTAIVLSLGLSVVATQPATAATSFIVDGLEYTVVSGTTNVIVSGSPSPSANVVVPSSVTNSGTSYSVVEIGNFSFAYSSTIVHVSLPNSAKIIGQSAFANASTLKTIDLGTGLEYIYFWAFSESGLTSVVLPDSMKTLRYGAFWGTPLTSVALGTGLTEIESVTFQATSALTTVTIPSNVTAISDLAFAGAPLTDVYLLGAPPTLVAAGNGSSFETSAGLTVHVSSAFLSPGYTNGFTTPTWLGYNVVADVTRTFATTPSPTISGTTTVGQTLTAVPGTWSPAPDSFTYVWKRGGVAIDLATAATYNLQVADVGQVISVTVTAVKTGYTSTAKTSASTAAIAAAAASEFVTTPTPTITGTTTVGQTLTAVTGSWSPAPDSFSYVWKRGGVAIDLATTSSYVLQVADAGQVISVTVTAVKTGYTSTPKTSANTTAITGAAFTLEPTPTITGTTTVGQTLTAVPGTWSPVPDSFTYVWKRGGVAISLATDSTYVLQVADAGKLISVTVTAVKTGYSSTAKTSANSVAIVGAPFTFESTPTVTGVTAVGQTLTVVTGSWSPSPDSVTFVWKRGGVAISSATDSSYVLQAADVGQVISVTVTAVKTGHSSTAKTSANSVAIVGAPFTFESTPTVTGVTAVGQTLRVVNGSWLPAPDTFTYVWKRGGVAISLATASSYVLQAADVGQSITVSVTTVKAGYVSVVTTGTTVGVVVLGTFVRTPVPTISGRPIVGNVLTAKAGSWSPRATLKYVWMRDGKPIVGAILKKYVLTSDDRGRGITLEVTGTRPGFTSVTKLSAATADVTG